MTKVIIHGPKASGKTKNADLLKNHFGCKRIVDGWWPPQKLKDGDLALTDWEPPFGVSGAVVCDIASAIRMARRGGKS